MYEIKIIGKVFTSKCVGTGPSSYEKRIYRAAVSQSLGNTVPDYTASYCTKQGSQLLTRRCASVILHIDNSLILVESFCLLSTACCLLPVACCLLSTVCYLLSSVCCLLPSVYCLRSSVYCLLSTVCCLLSTLWCLLSTVYCLPSAVYCLLSTPRKIVIITSESSTFCFPV